MPVEKMSISLHPDVSAEIQKRAAQYERSTIINRALERYFDLLALERRHLRELFSDGETGLICDVFNGTAFWDSVSVRLAWANVQDGIEMDGLDQKWKIDGPALITKVRDLDASATLALVDAVEMWWQRVAHGEQPGHASEVVFTSKVALRYPNNSAE